ncbi:MAG: hypothetical protein JW829_16325 [Pirellulales bacterium]|nr:hypothetical protein [Pirellulales bacterium]
MSDPDSIIDDALLDRLVDQELNPDQQRRLLKALDREPDGWRRVALAFIEAQAWRGSFRELIHEPNQSGDQTLAKTSGNPQVHGWRVWRPLALAAGLFIAFTFGLLWRGGLPPENGPNDPLNAVRTVDRKFQLAGQNSSGQNPTISENPWLPGPSGLSEDAMMLIVDGEGQRNLQLPVTLIKEPDLDSRIPRQFSTSVPEPLRRRLEKSGYHVQTQRRYAPIPLQDGQRMYVPVEDTRIMPVRMPVY